MPKPDRLEYEFLPPALEIEETPPRPLGRALIWIILLITISTFLWAYFGRVDEVAVARGKIIPDGRVKVVQPLETGVIRAIHVVEGQRVKEGQLLIELDPTIKQADAASTAKALVIQVAIRERLQGELAGGRYEMPEKIPPGLTPEILRLQRRLRETRDAEYQAREEAQKLVMAQREKALLAARAIVVKLEKTCAIIRELEASYRILFEKRITPKTELLEKQKELYTNEQELEAQRNVVQQARDSLDEARQTLVAIRRERERGILTDILESEKAIVSIEGEMIKAQKKFELERLTSPVAGTVHGLSLYTVGGVATPAQALVTVVPEGTPLIFEVSVLNKDIGFVRVGQEAEIKLDTFPFQKYGTIKGRVVTISPDAFDDEKQGPIYKVKVRPDSQDLPVDGHLVPLAPGMTAAVEIKTDQRRIIEFFLSPIIKYADESLTLR